MTTNPGQSNRLPQQVSQQLAQWLYQQVQQVQPAATGSNQKLAGANLTAFTHIVDSFYDTVQTYTQTGTLPNNIAQSTSAPMTSGS